MSVDDLWYLSKKKNDDKRVKSSKYDRGKRWRCRYMDEAGEPRTKVFAPKTDAEDFDASARLKLAPETQLPGQAPSNVGFREYAERWRLSRGVWLGGWRPGVESSRTSATTCSRCSATRRCARSR